MPHARTLTAIAAALGFVTIARVATTQTIDPSTALPPTMWAAQSDASTIRFAWDHVPGPTSYVLTCDIGSRSRQVGATTVPLLAQKSTTAPPRRLTMVLGITDPGVPHACFLQWRADAKSASSARLAFNEITPTAPATGAGKTATPSGVTAQETVANEVTLTWNAVPGATAYVIGRAVDQSGFSLYCDVCPAETTFIDRFVKAGARHLYSVSALGPGGASGRALATAIVPTGNATAIASAASPSVDPTLKAPSGVTATVTGATSTRVSWSRVPIAVAYQLLRSVNGAAPAPMARIPAGTATQIDVPDDVGTFLGAGATQVVVVYLVKSEDANGFTTAASTSNTLTIDAKSAMPAGTSSANVSNAVATATSLSVVTLTWSPPGGGIPCALERSLSGGAFAALPPLAAGAARWIDSAPTLVAHKPRYRITCGTAKAMLPSVRFSDPRWPSILPDDGAGASTSATQPANLRAAFTGPDTVALTWGPPTNAIPCSLRRRSGGSSTYVTLRTFAIGMWYDTDTMAGLTAAKPQYQLACGDPKTGTVSAFPMPR